MVFSLYIGSLIIKRRTIVLFLDNALKGIGKCNFLERLCNHASVYQYDLNIETNQVLDLKLPLHRVVIERFYPSKILKNQI